MRVFPIVTAVLVCTVLYFVVLQREALLQFAGFFGGEEPAAEEIAEVETEVVAPAAPAEGAVMVVARESQAILADDAVLVRGRTEALRQVNVQAEISGRIISEPIRAGAFVEAGQTLCEIDPGTRAADLAEAEARLAEARAGLTAAEIDANAASRLSESGFASETRAASSAAALETARSAIQSAEAAVERAAEQIARQTITAPFDGLLESDTAELGTLMQPGALCATIIQLDPIKIVGFLPEAEVNRVETGALAGARLAGGTEVQGQVVFLSRSADPQTRTFRVEIEAENADLAIRDGQTADLLISTDGTMAHLLPSSALTLDDAGTLGVRIVTQENTAQFAPVSLLRDTSRGVWVSGLPEEVTVITVGQEFVTDGVPVEVTLEELSQ